MDAIAASALLLAFEAGNGGYISQGPGYFIEIAEERVAISGPAGSTGWRFKGAAARVVLDGEERLPGVVNRYSERESRAGIPTYRRVRQEGLYPGIDAVYYGRGGRLEYDVVAAAGADLAKIEIVFEEEVRIEEDGSLQAGRIRQRAPVASQDGTPVEVAFRKTGANSVGFSVGRYDRGRALVIDPVVDYGTFFGGPGRDLIRGVAVDASGAIYAVGQSFTRGSIDAFVTKLNTAGTLALYTTFLGGTGDDVANAVAVDRFGNAYLAGLTNSFNFPGFGLYQGGISDAFAAQVDLRGRLVWAQFLGGQFYDEATAIAVDRFGTSFIAGRTQSPDYPTTEFAFQPFGAANGSVDGFVTRLDFDGEFLFSTYVAGSFDDEINAIAVDEFTDVYLAGSTASFDFPVSFNAFQARCVSDAFVMKLSRDGTAVFYSTCLGGTRQERANGIAVDATGSAYVTGVTTSGDFPRRGGASSSCGQNEDAFAARFDRTGRALLFSGCVGGGGNDAGLAIALDRDGSAYVTGRTNSTDFPVTADAIARENLGFTDAFVAKISSGGLRLSSTYFGGNGDDFGLAVAVSNSGAVIVGGATASGNFGVTRGALNGGWLGDLDGFLVRLLYFANPVVNEDGIVSGATFGKGPVAPGSVIAVFGMGLAETEANAASLPLPRQLGNVTVRVNGIEAPLFFVSPTQINLQVPFEVQPGIAELTVGVGEATSPPVAFEVSRSAPEIFREAGSNRAIATEASPGGVAVVYLTGAGPVAGNPGSGMAAPVDRLVEATLPFAASIAGEPAEILFLGLAPTLVGVYQANVRVPAGVEPGEHPLVISVGNVGSEPAMLNVTARP